jgi:3-dehydrosphinganine reductase
LKDFYRNNYRNQYRNKYVVITGGSEGIGRALALDLTKAGADVTILSRTIQKLEHTHKEMEALRVSPEQKLNYVICDVTQFETVKKVFDQLIFDHRVPDILMNVAGYAQPGYIHEQEIHHFDDMINLNLFGVVHTCKAIAPYFMKEKKGIILNTSSMAGFLGLFGYTAYCASKFAVVGFSEALRRELKPFNVQVSVLCPPNTKTPGLEKENRVKPKEILETEEKAKVATAEEVSLATLNALRKKKTMIIPTVDGSLAYLLNKISPKIIDQFVKRKLDT